MTIFRTIRSLLFPPKPTGLPFDVKPHELAALRELQSSEYWEIFQLIIDKQITLYADQLLAATNDSEVNRLRGAILGLRKAGTLATEIIRQQDFEDVRKLHLERTAIDRDAERALSLYATGFNR